MRCPKCNSEAIYVRDTMCGLNGNIYRRRKCADCNTRFRTMEIILEDTEECSRDYAAAVENKSALYKSANDKRRARKRGEQQ